MINEIVLKNNSQDMKILLNRTDSMFLLDDNGISWGDVSSEIDSYNSISRIGVVVSNTIISQPRTVTFTGWLINDYQGTISEKKAILNKFCNLFDNIEISTGSYTISGQFSKAIKYSEKKKENNDILCKFLITVYCPNPMFHSQNPSQFETGSFGQLPSSGSYPLVVSNFGQIDVGMEVYLYISSTSIKGLTIHNDTTGLEFKIKDTAELPANYILYISTIRGQLSIKMGSGNEFEEVDNAFDIFDTDSEFIQLQPGQNILEFSSISDLSDCGVEVFVRPMYYNLEEQ